MPIEAHEDSSRGSTACHGPVRGLVKACGAKGLAKFEKLSDELRAAEAKSFGTRLPRGMEQQRKLLVQAIASDRNSRIRIGVLAAGYRDHYKIEEAWMPIGRSIALSLGYKSYTSLNSLMKAAVSASRIPEPLLAALIELQIDPTESKYRQLVKELQSTDFSGNDEEAHDVVKAAIERFHTCKQDAARKRKKDASASAAQFGNRIARQLAIHMLDMPANERRARVETIVREIEKAIRVEMPDWRIRVTWENRHSTTLDVEPVSASASDTSSRGELLPIQSSGASPGMSAVPDITPPAFVDNRPLDPLGVRPHSKRPVQSVGNNQPSLFDEPAVVAEQR